MCKGNLWGQRILYETYNTIMGGELMVVFFALWKDRSKSEKKIRIGRAVFYGNADGKRNE